MTDAKPQYTPTTEQLDLDRRLRLEAAQDEARENGIPFVHPDAGQARSFAVEGNDLSGYIGTTPEYQTYAVETNKPLVGQGDRADNIIEDELREAQSATSIPDGTDADPDADEPTNPTAES